MTLNTSTTATGNDGNVNEPLLNNGQSSRFSKKDNLIKYADLTLGLIILISFALAVKFLPVESNLAICEDNGCSEERDIGESCDFDLEHIKTCCCSKDIEKKGINEIRKAFNLRGVIYFFELIGITLAPIVLFLLAILLYRIYTCDTAKLPTFSSSIFTQNNNDNNTNNNNDNEIDLEGNMPSLD